MYATDFLFGNKKLSDFGCILCEFDGNEGTVSGGKIEFNTVKSPNKDRYNFYGAQFNEVLTWNTSIMKDPCKFDDVNCDQDLEIELADWLLNTNGYDWLQFDQEGWEDICYHVKFDMTPHQICGKTVGYDLVITTDCGYGFSQEQRKKFILNSSKPYNLYVSNGLNKVCYPHLLIAGSGDFYISNDNDSLQNASNDGASEFTNVNGTVTMDSENEIIKDIETPNDFNWYFMRLVNGDNKITTNSTSDLKIEMTYREIRRVLV